MKKIISFFLLVYSIIWINYSTANNVWVYATVWSQNQQPIVLEVTPSSDPKLIKRLQTQNYLIKFSDKEKDNVTFTINAENWFLNLSSGEIKTSDYVNGFWYINFTYLAPSNPPSWNFSKIYVTINDWTNIVIKKLNIYIY